MAAHPAAESGLIRTPWYKVASPNNTTDFECQLTCDVMGTIVTSAMSHNHTRDQYFKPGR